MAIPVSSVVAQLRSMQTDPCRSLRYLTKLRAHGPFDPVLQDFALGLFPRWGWDAQDYYKVIQEKWATKNDPRLQETLFALQIYHSQRRDGSVTAELVVQINSGVLSWIPCVSSQIRITNPWSTGRPLIAALEGDEWRDQGSELQLALAHLDAAVEGQIFADVKGNLSPPGRKLYILLGEGRRLLK